MLNQIPQKANIDEIDFAEDCLPIMSGDRVLSTHAKSMIVVRYSNNENQSTLELLLNIDHILSIKTQLKQLQAPIKQ